MEDRRSKQEVVRHDPGCGMITGQTVVSLSFGSGEIILNREPAND